MTTHSRLSDIGFFVVGPMLFVFGLFSFEHAEATGDNSIAVAYFYGALPLLSLVLGTALMAIGWLRKTWQSAK